MTQKTYDVAVIGAGPGGYVAAIRAAHHGLSTVLVERDSRLGGTCLLRGCIPTKSLLHSADVYDQIQRASHAGVIVDGVRVDFQGVQEARAKVVEQSARGVAYLMKQNKIDVVTGTGSLRGGGEVAVDGKPAIKARSIVLATGSRPRVIPALPVDGKRVVTSDEILELKAPPARLVVLGSGAVGVEFASAYRRFGSEVTVVEMLDRVLPNEDAEVSKAFAAAFKKRGIEVLVSTKVASGKATAKAVKLRIEGPQGASEIVADVCLVAVGRAPVTEGLSLDAAGLKTDEGGFLPVDGMMRTAAAGIYAIGDVVRTPQLAHIASAEALVAVDHIAGKEPQALRYIETPSCTYSDPEVASVGLTEDRARAAGHDLKVGRFPFSALGKARIMGQGEGFVKVVSEARYGEILGVHIIGPRATDLIAEACVAMRGELTIDELAHTIHAHPTLPEAVLEAAHGALGRPIHL